MNLPVATQKLNRKGQVMKTARCPMPSHRDSIGRGAQTSHFLGAQETFEGDRFWTFSCHHGGKPYHNFQALPDPEAPETADKLDAWKEKQLQGKKNLGLA